MLSAYIKKHVIAILLLPFVTASCSSLEKTTRKLDLELDYLTHSDINRGDTETRSFSLCLLGE